MKLLDNFIKVKSKPGIIVLQNINKIEKVKKFISELYLSKYKIIII
jgi:hypothetical protein